MRSRRRKNRQTKGQQKNNRKSKRAHTKGGKISGRGAFGCVIQPHIPCSNSTTPLHPDLKSIAVKLYAPTMNARNKNRINSKFPTEDLKSEEILRRISNALQYFVIPYAACDISEADVERHEDSRECAESMRLYPKKLLWMEAAEGDLWNSAFVGSLYTDIPPSEFLKALRNVLVGLDILHKHGIIHRDIKPDNILWGMQPHFWIKLSDFGEAMIDPVDFYELSLEDIRNLAYVFQLVFSKFRDRLVGVRAYIEEFQQALRSDQPQFEKIIGLYDTILKGV